MKTIKHSFSPLSSSLGVLSLVALLNVSGVGIAWAEKSAENNAEENKVYRQEPISPLPQTVEVDTDKAALGEMLFSDTRLSSNKQIACATCHQLEAGGDDNLSRGLSLTAENNVMNTPSIFNAQFNFRQNWNGSANTLQQQIELMMSDKHQFNNSWDKAIEALIKDNEFVQLFNQSYQDGINKKNIIEAIVEFEKTLITPDSRFDRYLRNEDVSLTKEEEKGYILFKEFGCISCHQGINIGGNLFQKFGVFYNYFAERGNITEADYGRKNITGREIDKYVFKVPSLRNIAVTAPYLHDGSAKNIEEAIYIMGRSQLGRKLTKKQIKLIKAFLETLTGEYRNMLPEEKS